MSGYNDEFSGLALFCPYTCDKSCFLTPYFPMFKRILFLLLVFATFFVAAFLHVLTYVILAVAGLVLCAVIFAAALFISFKRKGVLLNKFSMAIMTSTIGQKIVAKQMEKMAAGQGMITPDQLSAAMATQGDEITAQAMGLGVSKADAQNMFAQLAAIDPNELMSMANAIQKSLEGPDGEIDVQNLEKMMGSMGMGGLIDPAMLAGAGSPPADAQMPDFGDLAAMMGMAAPEVDAQTVEDSSSEHTASEHVSTSADTPSEQTASAE
jgi:hypothetical protein